MTSHSPTADTLPTELSGRVRMLGAKQTDNSEEPSYDANETIHMQFAQNAPYADDHHVTF